MDSLQTIINVYITDKINYEKNIELVYKKLEESIPTINKIFKYYDFSKLLEELSNYSKNVEKDYEEYIKTNEIWNRLKK